MEVKARYGRTAARSSHTGILNRRELSTAEKLAAIFGPTCVLPT
jgi:hypothetical protein